MLAVVPGLIRASGDGSQLHHWTSPGDLLPSVPGGGEVSLCPRRAGAGAGPSSGWGDGEEFSLQGGFL